MRVPSPAGTWQQCAHLPPLTLKSLVFTPKLILPMFSTSRSSVAPAWPVRFSVVCPSRSSLPWYSWRPAGMGNWVSTSLPSPEAPWCQAFQVRSGRPHSLHTPGRASDQTDSPQRGAGRTSSQVSLPYGYPGGVNAKANPPPPTDPPPQQRWGPGQRPTDKQAPQMCPEAGTPAQPPPQAVSSTASPSAPWALTPLLLQREGLGIAPQSSGPWSGPVRTPSRST